MNFLEEKTGTNVSSTWVRFPFFLLVTADCFQSDVQNLVELDLTSVELVSPQRLNSFLKFNLHQINRKLKDIRPLHMLLWWPHQQPHTDIPKHDGNFLISSLLSCLFLHTHPQITWHILISYNILLFVKYFLSVIIKFSLSYQFLGPCFWSHLAVQQKEAQLQQTTLNGCES